MKYIIKVKELMELLHLPFPRRKNQITNHGETLPIITGGYWKC